MEWVDNERSSCLAQEWLYDLGYGDIARYYIFLNKEGSWSAEIGDCIIANHLNNRCLTREDAKQFCQNHLQRIIGILLRENCSNIDIRVEAVFKEAEGVCSDVIEDFSDYTDWNGIAAKSCKVCSDADRTLSITSEKKIESLSMEWD